MCHAKRFYLGLWVTTFLQLSPNVASAASCSTDPRLIKIPAGEFWMGSNRVERDYGYRIGSPSTRQFRWYDNWELPATKVSSQTYYIDRHLVTHKDYLQFVRATDHRAPYISKSDYQNQGYLVHQYSEVRQYLWTVKAKTNEISYPEHLANHPVVLVSQNDAELFCRWRGEKLKLNYSLPNELQWEKAARGSDGRYYPWGNKIDNHKLNFAYRHGSTTAVGQFPLGASPYGLMDMAGNVFEWTTTYFDSSRVTMKGGGSWDDQGGICRAASRHGRNPKSRHILFGFRCSCID